LQYKITSSNGYNMSNYEDIPKSEEAKDVILAYSVLIEPNTTQEYVLELVYHDSETVDQSEDIGSILSGKLGITEGTENLPTLTNAILASYPPQPGRTNFTTLDTGTPTLYTAEDYDGNPTYYFSGDGTYMNNWVSFADKLWRIIRINSNGSVRLLYAGTGKQDAYIAESEVFNNELNNPGYVGWMYSTGSTLEEIRKNENKSNVYIVLENWYNNLTEKERSLIDKQAIYCNDRNLKSTDSFSTFQQFHFIAYERLYYNQRIPTFDCPDPNDRFTTFGLMTADEIAFAGGRYGTNAPKAYFSLSVSNTYPTGSNNWWTMTPIFYSGSYASIASVMTSNNGYLGYLTTSNAKIQNSVRPVISLNKTVKITGGDGSGTNPYIISI